LVEKIPEGYKPEENELFFSIQSNKYTRNPYAYSNDYPKDINVI